MKKLLFFLLTATMFFTSCEKDHEDDENLCPVLKSSQVPTSVSSALNSRYSNATIVAWFDKDGRAYAALIKDGNQKKLVQFSLDGQFIKEEIKNHDDDDDEDDIDALTGKPLPKGCKCALPKKCKD